MTSKKFQGKIAPIAPLIEGVVNLFHPFAEGAIHDLQQGRVVAIYNNISKRKIGDPSPITELGIEVKDFPDVFDPYYKTNWDGRQLKCVSVTIRDNRGKPIGLVCINFDTTAFQAMGANIEKFISLVNKKSLNPVEQFDDNWQQHVGAYIEEYLQKHSSTVSSMSKERKSALVGEMYDRGFFNYRDAAAQIAKELSVSRTTIYNYLKDKK